MFDADDVRYLTIAHVFVAYSLAVGGTPEDAERLC